MNRNIKIDGNNGIISNVSVGNNNKQESRGLYDAIENKKDIFSDVDLDDFLYEILKIKLNLKEKSNNNSELYNNIEKIIKELKSGDKLELKNILKKSGTELAAFASSVGAGLVSNTIYSLIS